MAEIPVEMLQQGRAVDPHFDEDEELYRRFAPENLEGNQIAIDAVGLPDMSVIRQKYGRPKWLVLDDDFANWGVFAFLVRDIPPNREILQAGILSFTLEPRHVPYAHNYPHSEIWVFRDGVHICAAEKNLGLLDPDFHLRWRERIVLASHVVIHPAHSD